MIGKFTPLGALPEHTLRRVHQRATSRLRFEDWRSALLERDPGILKKDELVSTLRALRDAYITEIDIEVRQNNPKADQVRKIVTLRGSAGAPRGAAALPSPPPLLPLGAAGPPLAPAAAGGAGALPAEDEDSEGNGFLQRYASPALPQSAAPPQPASPIRGPGGAARTPPPRGSADSDRTPQLGSPPAVPEPPPEPVRIDHSWLWNKPADMAAQQLAAALAADPSIGGRFEPNFPPLRWGCASGIAVAAQTQHRRQYSLRFPLAQAETSAIADRKRSRALHMVCLRPTPQGLRPAAWPEDAEVSCNGEQCPQAAPWRPKNEEKTWFRTVTHVDLSRCLVGRVVPALCAAAVVTLPKGAEENVCFAMLLVATNGGQHVRDRILSEPTLLFRWDADDAGGCRVDRICVPLRDPVTLARMVRPVRGIRCSHAESFDMDTYLTFSARHRIWNCPVCEQEVPAGELRIDGYLSAILADPSVRELHTHIEVHPDGRWRPREESSLGAVNQPRKRRLPASERVELDGAPAEGGRAGGAGDALHAAPKWDDVTPLAGAQASATPAAAAGRAPKRPRLSGVAPPDLTEVGTAADPIVL